MPKVREKKEASNRSEESQCVLLQKKHCVLGNILNIDVYRESRVSRRLIMRCGTRIVQKAVVASDGVGEQ